MREIGHFIGGREVKGTVGPLRRRLRSDDRRSPGPGGACQASEVEPRVEARGGAAGMGGHQSAAPRPRDDEVPGTGRSATYDELARLLSRASMARPFPTPRATSSAASKWSSSPAAFRICMKGEYTEGAGPGIDIYSMRQPLGVVAGITPFNFPAMIPMWKFAPAIACGNAFILKPSERDPGVPMRLAELMIEAGLPAGILNVVNGDKEAVDAILDDPDIKAVGFVGSSRDRANTSMQRGSRHRQTRAMFRRRQEPRHHHAGRRHGPGGRRADRRGLRLGRRALHGGFGRGARRQDHGRRLMEKLDPARREPEDRRLDRSERRLRSAGDRAPRSRRSRTMSTSASRKARSSLVDGRGFKMQGYEKGFYLGGCLFDNVTKDMRIYKEEIFGPVLSVVRAKDYDEALALPSEHEYGNGVAIFTRDGDAAREFAAKVNVGMVGINVPIPVPIAYYTFGGWKRSGFGDLNQHGPDSIRFYTKTKTVTSRWPSGVKEGAEFSIPTMKEIPDT